MCGYIRKVLVMAISLGRRFVWHRGWRGMIFIGLEDSRQGERGACPLQW